MPFPSPRLSVVIKRSLTCHFRTHLFTGQAEGAEVPESWAKVIPLGRYCQPTDFANTACYLASDEAFFLTGIDILTDGGRSV